MISHKLVYFSCMFLSDGIWERKSRVKWLTGLQGQRGATTSAFCLLCVWTNVSDNTVILGLEAEPTPTFYMLLMVWQWTCFDLDMHTDLGQTAAHDRKTTDFQREKATNSPCSQIWICYSFSLNIQIFLGRRLHVRCKATLSTSKTNNQQQMYKCSK